MRLRLILAPWWAQAPVHAVLFFVLWALYSAATDSRPDWLQVVITALFVRSGHGTGISATESPRHRAGDGWYGAARLPVRIQSAANRSAAKRPGHVARHCPSSAYARRPRYARTHSLDNPHGCGCHCDDCPGRRAYVPRRWICRGRVVWGPRRPLLDQSASPTGTFDDTGRRHASKSPTD